jgi:pyrroloquinoline quinone biosynthesis protein D
MNTFVLPQLPRLSRPYRMQYEEVQGHWVLLYPEGMVQLNPSAAEIFRRCDGVHTVADIVAELEALFGVTDIETQVQDMLHEGARRGWIH